MKFKATIYFDVETEDYHKVEPTIEGAKELVAAMINGEADFPCCDDSPAIDIKE